MRRIILLGAMALATTIGIRSPYQGDFGGFTKPGRNPYRNRNSGSIAEGNRHGGPHKHSREIARRLRQEDRLWGFSLDMAA